MSKPVLSIESPVELQYLRDLYFEVLDLYPRAPSNPLLVNSPGPCQVYTNLNKELENKDWKVIGIDPGETSSFSNAEPCMVIPVTNQVLSSPRVLEHQGGSLFLRESSTNTVLSNRRAYLIPEGGFCLLPVKSNYMVFILQPISHDFYARFQPASTRSTLEATS